MRRCLIVLTWCVAISSQAAAQSVDAKALRDVIEMPRTTVWFGVGYDSATRSIKMTGDKEERPARIAALEKALAGDARDAERLGQLADLYENETKSKDAAALALASAKQLVAANPKRAEGARLLGEAFDRVGERAEAEKALRDAVRLAPEDERCWTSLGLFLGTEVYRDLVGKESFDFSTLAAVLRKNRIDAARVAKVSRVQAAEASACFDKAVQLNPKRAQPYRERAGYRLWMAMLADALVQADLQNAEEPIFPADRRDRDFLPDMKMVAELEPQSPRNIALPMLFELMTLGDVQELEAQHKDPESSLSRHKKRLATIANEADPFRAGEACYVLGLIESLPGGDMAKATEFFRRDEKLRPDSRQSEAQLDASLIRSKNYAQLAERCEARLRTRDDPRTRYTAARVSWATGSFAKAEEHVRAGLKLELTDTLCNLSLVAALLRRGDAEALAEARLLLRKSKSFIDSEHAADAATLSAILAALSGDAKSARAALADLSAQQSEETVAAKALKILGGPPERLPEPLGELSEPLRHRDDSRAFIPSAIPVEYRELVRFPALRTRVTVNLNNDGSLEFENVTPSHAAEIAALEKSLGDGPEDVERLCRLCVLQDGAEERKQTSERALALALRLRQADPTNGNVELMVGRALLAAERFEEAERSLRTAAKLLPDDSECRIALGQCLARIANRSGWQKGISLGSTVEISKLPPIEDAAKCRRALDEADACFDEAIRLAPESERAYRARAAGRFGDDLLRCALDRPRDKEIVYRLWSERVLADLEACADRSPEDPLPRGVATYFRLLAAKEAGWLLPSVLGADSPEYVREKGFLVGQRKRLEALSNHRDRRIAADACYILAVLSACERGDYADAMTFLSRDETLLPASSRSTLLIDCQLWCENKFDQLYAHAEMRIKEHDNPIGRFLLANRSFGAGDLNGAERQLRTGLKFDADGIECNLGLAVALLHRGDKRSLEEVGRRLDIVERAAAKNPDRLSDAAILRCVHLAMTGDADAARFRLRAMIEKRPGLEAAEKLLKALSP